MIEKKDKKGKDKGKYLEEMRTKKEENSNRTNKPGGIDNSDRENSRGTDKESKEIEELGSK